MDLGDENVAELGVYMNVFQSEKDAITAHHRQTNDWVIWAKLVGPFASITPPPPTKDGLVVSVGCTARFHCALLNIVVRLTRSRHTHAGGPSNAGLPKALQPGPAKNHRARV